MRVRVEGCGTKAARRVNWSTSQGKFFNTSVFAVSYKILQPRGSSVSTQEKGSTISSLAWASAFTPFLKSRSPSHSLYPLPRILLMASPPSSSPVPMTLLFQEVFLVFPVVAIDWELLAGRTLTYPCWYNQELLYIFSQCSVSTLRKLLSTGIKWVASS